MSRFPFGIPNSWYLVGYSDELTGDTLRPLPYLGRNMIALRGEDGAVSVLDGWCPHLGANLAVGATCEQGTLRCPFHGWRFDASGRCVEIPYAKRIPEAARLARYPVLERNGMIFVWGGEEGVEPFFEIPVIPEWQDPAWTDRWMRFEWTVATHPQEISENGVDSPHLHTVHLMEPVEDYRLRFEGPAYFWSIGVSKEFQTLPEFSDGFTMKGENWGLAYSLIRQRGRFNTIVITSFTAVDDETTCIKMAILAERNEMDDDALQAELEGYMKEHGKVAEQDFEIWENKRYEPNPVLCDSDGPIAEHRRWASQFYGGEAAARGSSVARRA
ncbi:MAG: Rieske (2Fe-2S) protein [Deltaproteobacteria bacterium]|jgi:phenylpropionate dioxygenase-like ring-hydroxylating dioxygenase large terminal subunit|nr:Rieske (2Fe-2S) protein [Deltaproteobacteria bacterium]